MLINSSRVEEDGVIAINVYRSKEEWIDGSTASVLS
jgi:hypothetical protein